MAAFIILSVILLLEVGMMAVASTPRRFWSDGWTKVLFGTQIAFFVTLPATMFAAAMMSAPQ